MLRAWRLVLIWLMVAALPFKAVAGIALVACGPQHGSAHSHGGVQQAAAAHHGHGAEHGPAADHGHAAGHAGGTPADAAHAAASDAGASKTKCSTCAPCCAAAAPPFAACALPAAAATDRVNTLVADTFPNVVPDVPHRPPRPTFA